MTEKEIVLKALTIMGMPGRHIRDAVEVVCSICHKTYLASAEIDTDPDYKPHCPYCIAE